MIISTLIIAVSAVLFLYWFRYTCVLILSTRTMRDYSEEVAAANKLAFVEVQDLLGSAAAEDLDTLQQLLERDYRVVNDLMKRATDLRVGGDSLEEAMLRIDFRVMSLWYNLSRRYALSNARTALDEMSQVVAHFANSCGKRAAESADA